MASSLILYGTVYGTSKLYAQELSKLTGIEANPMKNCHTHLYSKINQITLSINRTASGNPPSVLILADISAAFLLFSSYVFCI